MHLPPRLQAGLPQRPEKIVPIDIVYEDVFAPISPADHMVNRSRILHSRFARHGPNLPPFPSLSQPSNAQCCGVTIGRVLKGLQTGFGDDFFGRFSFNIQHSTLGRSGRPRSGVARWISKKWQVLRIFV
jgi:hypothetical protein